MSKVVFTSPFNCGNLRWNALESQDEAEAVDPNG